MSVEAITWALAQQVPHSSAKFVLVVMANCADAEMVCWPSAAHLCDQTSQDRKTVQENMRRLKDWGYIEDAGERKGSTKQVIVYRLKTPENGPVKEAQKRNTSENGTHPIFPPNRPEIPHKEAQISPQTGPKTGDGTVRNHQGTIKEPKADETAEALSGVDAQVAKDWRAMRAKQKAQVTLTAIRGIEREGRKAGLTLEQALIVCIERNWRGFEASWLLKDARAGPGYQSAQDKARAKINELTGRTHVTDHAIIDIN